MEVVNVSSEGDRMLGKLQKVTVREVWKDEEKDFNPWLEKEGLQLLAQELGLQNVNVKRREVNVGGFYVDLLAQVEDIPEQTKLMIIEAQLEKTDHKHLGQLLTYAANLDAAYIVWIVENTREEHREAIEWLNTIAESSDKDVGFFLVKIELWKINDSLPAPKFTVVVSPNYWTKNIKKSSKDELGEKASIGLSFLTNFYEYIKNSMPVSPPNPSTPMYYSIPSGTSKAQTRVGVSVSAKYVRVGIYFPSKEIFEKVKEKAKELEELFPDDELVWDSMPKYKGAVVDVFKKDIDFNNKDLWNNIFEWIEEKVKK